MKKSIYTVLPLKEKLVNKIMIYYQTVWAELKYTSSNHKLWLLNFTEDERLNSLYLLSKFMFFGKYEIKELLISIFRDKFKYKIIEQFRKANADTTDLDKIATHFEDQLKTTRFVSLGDASESGSHILMLFRQYNNLSKKNMKSSSEIISSGSIVEPHVKHYVFIDDFCGSGETAIKCNALIQELKDINPMIEISYFVLFATQEGFENIGKDSAFDNFETSYILDTTFKCFDDTSRYFIEKYSEIDKTNAKDTCIRYGLPLVVGTPIEGHPLGFNDGQLLISFAHNTPDNTLPVFWSDKDWHPIFIRYIKT